MLGDQPEVGIVVGSEEEFNISVKTSQEAFSEL